MDSKKSCILPLLLIASGVLAQEANLTLKPVAKKKYNLEMNSRTNITQSMAGMEMKMNMAFTAKAVMEIEKIDPNGDFTAITRWSDMEATSSALGKDTTIRAENLNLIMKTVYDKTGKTIKNERIDSFGSTNTAVAMLEQSAKNIKLSVLPAKTVKKGDTWKSHSRDTIQTKEFPVAMIIDVDNDYSFAGTATDNGAEYYRINCSGPTKVSGEGVQSGLQMQIEGTGMNEGYSLHYKETLLPASMEVNTGMDMSIMVSGAQSMAIPITQNSVVKIQFTEVK